MTDTENVSLKYLEGMVERAKKGVENLNTFDLAMLKVMDTMHSYYQGDIDLEQYNTELDKAIDELDDAMFELDQLKLIEESDVDSAEQANEVRG